MEHFWSFKFEHLFQSARCLCFYGSTQTIEQSGPNIGRKVKKVAGVSLPSRTPTSAKTPFTKGRPKKIEETKHSGTLSEPRLGSVASLNNMSAEKGKKTDKLQSVNQHKTVDPVSLRYVVSWMVVCSYQHLRTCFCFDIAHDGETSSMAVLCCVS